MKVYIAVVSPLHYTNLLVVVHRCPVVPTQANRTAGTTMSKLASLSTKIIIEMQPLYSTSHYSLPIIALFPPSSRMDLPVSHYYTIAINKGQNDLPNLSCTTVPTFLPT